jgi:chromate reductase, NAD(P)H dehydrogenase (quinone)
VALLVYPVGSAFDFSVFCKEVVWLSPSEPGLVNLRILAICGSLRKASYNRLTLRALAALAPEDFEITLFDLADVEMFSQDRFDASGYPPGALAFRDAVLAADAVIVGTPEYHHSIPGVLKNAIDWTGGSPAVFTGKPTAVISSAPGVHGGLRAQQDLRKILQACDALLLPRPELMLGGAKTKFDGDGHLTDAAAAKAMTDFMAAFRAWIVRLRQPAAV